MRGGAAGQGFMGCFIGDDIKHFYVKLSVVLISFLLLFPLAQAGEVQALCRHRINPPLVDLINLPMEF